LICPQVRRKADGAKDLVKEFVGKWQDNAAVVGDITHTEMKGKTQVLRATRIQTWFVPHVVDTDVFSTFM